MRRRGGRVSLSTLRKGTEHEGATVNQQRGETRPRMTWRKQGPGNRQRSQLGTSQRGPFHAPVPAPLSLTSFRGISPKRESVFLLGTLTPRLSVLPQKWRDEDGELPPAPLPNLSLAKNNKRDRPGDQTGGDTADSLGSYTRSES